jgi:predicted small lipoprotein YifL
MSSEAGTPSESRNRRPLRLAALAVVLAVLLTSLGCGLKGDPLPPLRPPEPDAEADAAGAEAEDPESPDDAGEEPGADDGDSEEDGDGAQRPR